jgi:hypothetical protein
MNTPIDRQGDLNLDELRFDPPRYKGRKLMIAMSRRAILTNILPGAVVAIAGVGTIGAGSRECCAFGHRQGKSRQGR